MFGRTASHTASRLLTSTKRCFDTVALREQFTEKTPNRLIRYVADHDMVATFQENEEFRMQRGNARTEYGCVLPALHRRKLALEAKLIVAGISVIDNV